MKLVKEWWPVWMLTALLSTLFTLILTAPGATPLSPGAVAIDEVSCTINMETTRSSEEIREDLERCFSIHMSWKKRNDYGR